MRGSVLDPGVSFYVSSGRRQEKAGERMPKSTWQGDSRTGEPEASVGGNGREHHDFAVSMAASAHPAKNVTFSAI